jgi:hypothetical protein
MNYSVDISTLKSHLIAMEKGSFYPIGKAEEVTGGLSCLRLESLCSAACGREDRSPIEVPAFWARAQFLRFREMCLLGPHPPGGFVEYLFIRKDVQGRLFLHP